MAYVKTDSTCRSRCMNSAFSPGHIYSTTKGGQVLILNGHRFHREYGNEMRSYWRCSKRASYRCKCKVRIINGAVKGIENLNINDVASEIEVDNVSDDDVIEVVRDEAPIEILSDGEEMELEKAKQRQQNSLLDNFIVDNFHFTSLSSEIQPHANTHSDVDNNIRDPLNTEIATGDPLRSLTLSPFETAPPVHSTTDTAEDLKSNQDESDENHYVNVTDLDQPDSWSKLVSSLDQLGCAQSDTNPLISEHNNSQVESKPDTSNKIVDNLVDGNLVAAGKSLVGNDPVVDNSADDKPADDKPADEKPDGNQVPEEKTIDNVREEK